MKTTRLFCKWLFTALTALFCGSVLAQETYTRISSVADLGDGGTFLIISEEAGTAMSSYLLTEGSNIYTGACPVTISGGSFTTEVASTAAEENGTGLPAEVTITKTGDYYTLYIEVAGMYINGTEKANLGFSGQASDSSNWTITFSGNNVKMVNPLATTRQICYRSGINNNYFKNFAESNINGTEYFNVQLYKKGGDNSGDNGDDNGDDPTPTPSSLTVDAENDFVETFAKCTADDWTADDFNTDFDNEGWTGENVRKGNGGVLMGTGSKAGSLTSPELNITAETFYLSFSAGVWNNNNEKTSFNLICGDKTLVVKELPRVAENGTSELSDDLKDYCVKFTNGTAATKLTFAAIEASKNRFYIANVKVSLSGTETGDVEEAGNDDPVVDEDEPVVVQTLVDVAAPRLITVEFNENVGSAWESYLMDMTDEDAWYEVVSAVTTGKEVAFTLDKDMVEGHEYNLQFEIADLSGNEAEIDITFTFGNGQPPVNEIVEVETLEALYDYYEGVLDGTVTAEQEFKVTGNLVVTHKDSYSWRVYLQDEGINSEEGAGILVYKARDYGFADLQEGDVIEGLHGTLAVYEGLFEVNPKTKMTAKSHDHEVFVDEVPISWITPDEFGLLYQSALVKLTNVWFVDADTFTFKKYLKVTDGTDTLQYYCSFQDADYVKHGDIAPEGMLDLTGIVTRYKNRMQITARSSADMVKTGELAVERAQGLAFGLYPNPSNGKFNIVLDKKAEVEIFSVGGTAVYSGKLNAGLNSLSLTQPGVYFVRITCNGKTGMQKVVVR